jgi:predicted GNAT family acetyltransferase
VTWQLTDDVEEYAARVWDLLCAHPAENTIALTAIHGVRAGRPPTDEPQYFAWYDDGSGVTGAVSRTPPHHLLLAVVPGDSHRELVDSLLEAGVEVPGAIGPDEVTERFAAAWTATTGLRAVPKMRTRLYSLGSLVQPSGVPGRARAARQSDVSLLVEWVGAFEAEGGMPVTDAEPVVRERVAHGLIWLWEDDSGAVVSMAGRNPTIGGVARVGPVYTPPVHRRRGYGAAVTAACAADALYGGAEQVVLFTDLANPTSNSVYRQIGFAPVRDDRWVTFG